MMKRPKPLEDELQQIVTESQGTYPKVYVTMRIQNAVDDLIERRLKEGDTELLAILKKLPDSAHTLMKKVVDQGFYMLETVDKKAIGINWPTIDTHLSDDAFNLCMQSLQRKGYTEPVFYRKWDKPKINPSNLSVAPSKEETTYVLSQKGKRYLSKVNGFLENIIIAQMEVANSRTDRSKYHIKEAEFQLKEAQSKLADEGIDVIFSIDKDSGQVFYTITSKK